MALQIWLPLRGNLNNYGVSNLTFTTVSSNTAVNTSGKVGSCYYNNSNSAGGIKSNAQINLGDKVSMFCWVKLDSFFASSNLTGILGQHRFSSNQGMGITMKYVSSTTGKLSLNTGNGSARTYNTYTGNTTLNAGTWYHVGFTYDKSTSVINFYVNGEFDGTATYVNQKNVADYVQLFGWSFSGTSGSTIYGNYQLKGSLNDVRIYDHVLSIKEIKEISKCLILHYKLDDEYSESTTNIDPCRNKLYENATTLPGMALSSGTLSIVNFDGYKCYKLEINKDNISAWFGVYINCNPISYGAAVGNTVTRSMMMYVPSGQTLPGHFTESIEGNSTNKSYNQYNYSKPNTWQRVWLKGTLADTGTNNYLHYFCAVSSGSVHITCYLRDFQMEIKDHITPFTPSSRIGKVLDYSGYDYTGTPNGNILLSSNSPKYQKCTHLTTDNDNISIPMPNVPTFTYAFWFKRDRVSHTTREMIMTGWYGVSFELNTNNTLTFKCATGTNHAERNVTTTTTFTSTSAWYHIACTHTDGVGSKIYVNGVLNNSYSFTELMGYSTSSAIIGKYPGFPFHGYVSDFRLYANELSAQDISNLYHDAFAIDNMQNSYCGELLEDEINEVDINKNGIIKCKEYSEIQTLYDNNSYIESDGSVWVKIFHHNNPTTTSNLFASTDTFTTSVYKNTNAWFNVSLCDKVNKWEFLVRQKIESSSSETSWRWIQNVNPMTATWDQAKYANITRVSGYSSWTDNYAGLFRYTSGTTANSNTYLRQANATSGNWYGATGCWTVYNGGIPGFNGVVVKTGYIDVYLRIDNVLYNSDTTSKIGKTIVTSNNLNEI